MITESSELALQNLRSLSTFEWYVIPLLALVFFTYSTEIKKAMDIGNWNAVFAGLTIFGADFINETWNGWVFHFTNYSAFWTAPGDSALRTMVGWNIEIMFMFAILGIVYYNFVNEDKDVKFLGIPNRWFWAIFFSAFCVFVEILLNIGGHLIWAYPWWERTFKGIWLIFIFGYLWFFVAAKIVIEMKSDKNKIITICIIYGIAIIANVIGLGIMGWVY